MPEQQARSAVAADHRSMIPGIPGVPWWAAVIMAVTGCAVGFAFDAGSGKDLTIAFSALYVAGCIAAVLTVRQAGVFTAVIQPPLILFCAVPGAYFLFHGAKFTGVKDLVINCGYPLIERFPLMLSTSVGVLLVGLVRWYLGRSQADEAEVAEATVADDGGRLGLVAKLAALVHRSTADPDPVDKKATKPRPRREGSGRSTVTERKTGRRPATTPRTRRPRPDDNADPDRDRARRRRPNREYDGSEPPRRTSRQPRDPDLHGRPSREGRRDHPTTRSGRFDPHQPFDSGPTPTPRRRPNGNTATHHPISQVRYRKAAGGDEPLAERARRPRKSAADSWEFDV